MSTPRRPAAPGRHVAPGPETGWARFVQRHGWRAYALPLLSVITVVVLVSGNGPTTVAAATGAAPTGSAAGALAAAVVADATLVEHEALPSASPSAGTIIEIADEATPCAGNDGQLVLVSISAQHLWACDDDQDVTSTGVTTGRDSDDDATPVGSWRVQARESDRDLVGEDYREHVQFRVPFHGNYGLHDAAWQTMPFGSPDWRSDGSRGCVHVPTPVMAQLYGWARVGRTVVTVKA